MKKFFKWILAFLMVISSLQLQPAFAVAAEKKEYLVIEDGYINSGSGNNAYDFESITSAHGSQYEGKGYKVLNTKNYKNSVRQLMSVMKLPLPSKEELETFNKYEFEFTIFKNPGYQEGDQTYHFYYTENVSWEEGKITWNNKPAEIKTDGDNLLFDFVIPKGEQYETKTDEEKVIHIDITDKVKELVAKGVESITIFTAAQNRLETSLMIHSKESGNGTLGAKLIASNSHYGEDRLIALIEECQKIEAGFFNEDSFSTMQQAITAAQAALTSGENVNEAYDFLLTAKKALTKDYVVMEDAYVRKDKSGTNYTSELLGKAHGAQYEGNNYRVLNAKQHGTRENISFMKVNLPSAEEIEKYHLDTFIFSFNMVRNPNYNVGDQTYSFYYTTDTNWSETKVTYNTMPDCSLQDEAHLLGEFYLVKGENYETKTDQEKHISFDISDKIKALVEANITEITIFTKGANDLDASIQFHSKESLDGTKGPKLSVSAVDYSEALQNLIKECEALDSTVYTEDSFQVLSVVLSEAKNLGSDVSALDKHVAYEKLLSAKKGLISAEENENADNVAYQKPTRSNLSKTTTNLVTDGKIETTWTGTSYPTYVDIDLMDTYDLNKLEVYVPEGKVVYYTIYGSNDGRDFTRIYQHHDDVAATSEGNEIVFEEVQSYRILRVSVEFTSGAKNSPLSEVKAYGQKTNTNTAILRDGSLEEILDVKAYDETDYAKPITKEETIENVYGIIDRTIGSQYRDWFSFELVDDLSENDWYELSDKDGKIHIKGNEGLSLTTGLNYYYKNYVNVHISEQTMQVKMPQTIVSIGKTVRKETPYQVRYAFNYCTLSYTFAFFGEDDWQRENDWLALNGVNVVLDLAGQEATWIKFLMNFGYSFDDAKDWLTGPAYTAWQFMNNMETLGGPVPDGYVKDRLELARSTQRWKNSLGMQTVLQGYGGMVPTNFNQFQPDVEITKQPNWGGNLRPSMIATDSAAYDEYAKKFYEAQEFVYGATTDYYAVDPYHEGGKRPEGLSDETVSEQVLESLLEYDKDAVWVVQAWQSNPTNGLLKGMGEYRNDHVLIVDLIKYPIKSWTKYDGTSYGSTKLDSKEFNGTDWAWCLLGNFGGNPTMNGQMQVMVDDILKAQKESEHMKGIGIISEGTYDNPVLYDLIFDLAWVDESFDLNQWLNKYIERRYGGISENARLAWQIMKDSNYNHGVRHTEEIFGLKNSRPQLQGTKNISYGADQLETAFKLLAEDFDKFKDSECYLYDLREIMRQHVSNYAVLMNNKLLAAKESKDVETYKEVKEKFLKAFDVLNAIQATDKDQLAGEWIGKATDLAKDDFSKDMFKMNAKTLITTWGTNPDAGLKEYGWRNYEGMFLDLTKRHWEEYVNLVENDLVNGTSSELRSARYYFDYEYKWVLGDQEYTRDPKNSPTEVKEVVDMVIEHCSITDGISPDAGNHALNKPVIVDENQADGRNKFAVDGNVETTLRIHASKVEDDIVDPQIIVDLIAEFQLSKVNIVFDDIADRYYNYEIYTSIDGENWVKVAEKTNNDAHEESGDVCEISDSMARFVKIVGIKDSKHVDDEENKELLIQEIRIYGERMLPNEEQLARFIDAVEGLNLSSNSVDALQQLTKLVDLARNALEEGAGPDDMNSVYWNLYDYLITLDLTGSVNLALNKPVSAHNDPSGYSNRINDGDLSTDWNAGRLSPTGKPYQHDPIVPGWAIIDLEGQYNIEEIKLSFPQVNRWYQYEIYVSSDGETWKKVGEKTTQNLPNEKEDTYFIEAENIRYIKLMATNISLESANKRATYGVREIEVYGTPYQGADKEALIALIEQVSTLNQTTYTKASWNALENVLTKAQEVVDDENASTEAVNEAYEALKSAIDQLEDVKKGVAYLVKEDAFIRSGSRANNNYNYEDIVKAHGEQYVGKGYRVMNVRYNGSDEIISVLKLNVPTKEEIEENKYDTFTLDLDIFKNLNYNVIDQEYVFYYTTNTTWSETTLTWNNRPKEISKDATNELFSIKIAKGDEYEFKSDEEKHISQDISTLIMDLANQGKTEVTIFVTAKYSGNTGLMIHTKESEAENKQPKLIALRADITLDTLKALVAEVENTKEDDYTKESYDAFKKSLESAKQLIVEESTDLSLIQYVYHELKENYDALEIYRVNVNDMEKHIYHEGEADEMPYRLFIPNNYDENKEYPVIVFLHGAGERGNDNEAQLRNALQTLFDTQEEMKQAIVIAPQCPKDKRWVETDWTQGCYDSNAIEEVQLKSVMNILSDVQQQYSADANRLYAVGLSMGGFGTWDLITRHSDVFAAAIPICGSGDSAKADILKDIPIWTFHGTKDTTVPYSGTQQMVDAIQAAGGNQIIFTTYEGAGHNIWNDAAAEEGLIAWLFGQRLSQRSDKTALNEAIREAETLLEDDYTADSWQQFEEAFEVAKNVANDEEALPKEVEEALCALQEAMSSLVSDTSALEAIVVQAEQEISKGIYTEESVRSLQQTLDQVKEAMQQELTPQQVKEYVFEVQKAMEELIVKSADYTAVDEAIAKAEALDKSLYKDVTALEEAINAVVRDKNITEQAAVDAMAKAIEDALAKLEYKDADYSKVDEAIAKAEALNKDEYEDLSALEEALANVVRGKNITQQDEVDAMAQAIEAALAGLVKVEQPTEPQEPVDPVEPTKPEQPVVDPKPEIPTQPARPTTPTQPTTPQTPTENEEPTVEPEPEVPTQPEKPTVPEKPNQDIDEPETPLAPTNTAHMMTIFGIGLLAILCIILLIFLGRRNSKEENN